MNEKLTMLTKEQTKGEKNLRAAQEKDWNQTESKSEKKSVPEYLTQAKSLAEELLQKIDPDAPSLGEELVPEPGYLEKSYDLMAQTTLLNGETLAINISTHVGPERSTSSMSVCRFGKEEISDPKYGFADSFKEDHRKIGLYMLVFPVENSRSFYFGNEGAINRGYDSPEDDGGLLKILKENVGANWEVLKKGYENSGALRP